MVNLLISVLPTWFLWCSFFKHISLLCYGLRILLTFFPGWFMSMCGSCMTYWLTITWGIGNSWSFMEFSTPIIDRLLAVNNKHLLLGWCRRSCRTCPQSQPFMMPQGSYLGATASICLTLRWSWWAVNLLVSTHLGIYQERSLILYQAVLALLQESLTDVAISAVGPTSDVYHILSVWVITCKGFTSHGPAQDPCMLGKHTKYLCMALEEMGWGKVCRSRHSGTSI